MVRTAQATQTSESGLPSHADRVWLERIASARDVFARTTYQGRAVPLLEATPEATRSFFEGYLSCDLEGVSVHWEAMRALMKTDITRPNPRIGTEALDILNLVVAAQSEARRERCWATYEEFQSQLRSWHRNLFHHRPGYLPGEFKPHGNQVDGIVFVAPDQVESTLYEGYEMVQSLPAGFAQAILYHQLVASVHPFVDGNGRVARLAMNAALTAAGEWRIIIPRACRYNYRIALRNICKIGDAEEFVRRLHFYQRWTASIRWRDLESTYHQIVRTGAMQNPLRLYIDFCKEQGTWDEDWPPAGIDSSFESEPRSSGETLRNRLAA